MIARIRRGNDFHVAWQIKRGGVAENLENVTDIKLERTIYGVTTEHTLFTVSGDTITAEIPAEVQTHNGQYKLTLSYELVDTGMSDDDRKCKVAIYAFAIVDPLGPADDLLTVDVASDVSIGFKGDKGLSAYQVWLEDGNVGTEDDYFAYLRQPATDAAASVSALEQTVSGNEALRVTAEQDRVDAELLRVGAESARSDAEGLRDSAEDDRIAAEGIRDANETDRINTENDRMDAEDLRDQAEVAREEAEGLRQTNTTAAIQNAGDATTAANTAAGLANSAATTANTAAGNANDAATAANTAAGLADTARTELTTAVNTKLGEADGNISEMNTTLSTYDGRVTQVEADIDQLAGYVIYDVTLSTTWEDNYFTKDNGVKVQISSDSHHYGKCATTEVPCKQYVGKTLNFDYGIDTTLDITTIAFVGASHVILEVHNYTAKGSVTLTIPSSTLYIRVGVEGTTSDRLAGCKSGISLKVTIGSKLGDLEQLTTGNKDNFVAAINEVNNEVNEIASTLPSLLYKVDNYVLNWEDNMLLRSNSDTQAGYIIPISSGYNLNRCATTMKVACSKSVGEKLKIYCATEQTRVSFYSGVEGAAYNGGQDYTGAGEVEVEITIPSGTTYFAIGYFDDNSSPASLDYVHAEIATISASAISEYYIRENAKLIQGTSLYTGKKFYSIGDSICAQEMWQPHLATLKQMDYQSAATRSATYPLGIGGSTICPKIQTTTSNNGDVYKVLDGNGNQVRNDNNEPLWFVIGRAPGQSIYIRAKFFEEIYDDAEVVVINAGANDSIGLNPVINSCDSVGEASDTAYTGLEYVDTGNAVIAKYYPNVAIYDDGTLDEEYKNGDYTILTSRPSLIACLKGIITTIVTACPEAMLVGNQIMRPNSEFSALSNYSAKVAGIKTAYQYYCIPVADMWNEMGVSNLNIIYYYKNDSPDPAVRVHPNDLGGQRMAMIIANKL